MGDWVRKPKQSWGIDPSVSQGKWSGPYTINMNFTKVTQWTQGDLWCFNMVKTKKQWFLGDPEKCSAGRYETSSGIPFINDGPIYREGESLANQQMWNIVKSSRETEILHDLVNQLFGIQHHSKMDIMWRISHPSWNGCGSTGQPRGPFSLQNGSYFRPASLRLGGKALGDLKCLWKISSQWICAQTDLVSMSIPQHACIELPSCMSIASHARTKQYHKHS